MSANDARTESADISLGVSGGDNGTGEAESPKTADVRARVETLLGDFAEGSASDLWPQSDVYALVSELARDVVTLSDALDRSAGELVRLRDSRQEPQDDLVTMTHTEAVELVDLLRDTKDAFHAISLGYPLGHTQADAMRRRIERWGDTRPKSASISSVSPSLTETDLDSGQERPAPGGDSQSLFEVVRQGISARAPADRLDRELAAREALDEIEATVKVIARAQQVTLRWIRRNGIVFDGPLGTDPKNWENVAFSLYTDLCEIDSCANALLKAAE